VNLSDEELPPDGRGHMNALYISVKYNSRLVSRALIDNGSSLNVCPKDTLIRLKVDLSQIRPCSNLIVRAFDGTKRTMEGIINLPLEMGPTIFDVVFHVMDIKPSFNFLLGRPWIHGAGAVPSTLHQKVKFMIDNCLITINGEEGNGIFEINAAPDKEAKLSTKEHYFHSFETLTCTYIGESNEDSKHQKSKGDRNAARIMLGDNYEIGKGLGLSLQGRVEPVDLKENPGRFGLGYEPEELEFAKIRARKGKGLAKAT
jgi:hypothetical protein